MSSKKSIRLDDYEKGLLITLITEATAKKDIYNQDDLEKLKDIKKTLQKKE